MNTPEPLPDYRFILRVILKTFLLFAILDLGFAAVKPLPALGNISAYNYLFPGRLRLPYSDHPERAYSLSLYNLEAMFASHELSAGARPAGEYRVLVIGDSSSWGFLLPPDQTVSAQITAARLVLPDGRRVHVYNLGYPVMSLAKDLLILSYAQRFQPDLIVWPLTLESFPYDKQLYPPLLQNNPLLFQDLIHRYHLKLDPHDPALQSPSQWSQTLIGQRRNLADLVRFQLYGVAWAATGIDQDIPSTYTPRQEDLSDDPGFHNLQPPHLHPEDLALDMVEAGIKMSGNTPVLIVNEPVFISHGKNSSIRYNFFYPRWAYDDYRVILQGVSQVHGWHYLDAWNAVANSEFTNSAVHLTSSGTAQFAQVLDQAILELTSGR